MVLPSSLRVLGALALTLSGLGADASAIRRDYPTDGSTLKWGPCQLRQNTTLPIQCAKLTVPLDYLNESDTRTIELDLARIPATKEPRRGSILLNFGGPGQPGVESLPAYAPIQGPVLGGYHDLVTWDPRGTGSTLRFSCFPTDPSGYYAAMGTTLAGSADTAVGQLWAEGGVIAEQCYKNLKDIGNYVGMAYTARDMISIVDALGEDGMLRYWGISGGTTLGATVSAMFPDRVDKVLLDGVMNVHEYYHSFGEPEFLASADDTFREFLSGCVKAPENCPLARNHTAQELEQIMTDLFAAVREQPVSYRGEAVIDYTLFKGFIFSSLYRPSSWPQLSAGIDQIVHENNWDTLVAFALGPGIPQEDQAILGIRCGDKGPRSDHLSDLSDVLSRFIKTSQWFWDWAWGYWVLPCAQWKFEAKERYEGDFHVRTKNPLLFVGNTWDPVTPLVSAKNVSSGFEGSVLLQHNGHGHLAMTQPSNCTDGYIQRYFLEGTLPKPGTICEPNEPLFAHPPSF
ncbi:TAP-like protein-domain-containing protein [Durotheca rogersii]|uniref:TAP-like protein-domain-containing protein n=1 Tax=Durotheca rogersii TaxID=419775 RepID=UPI002220CF3C|nr:TAP-like protein-domain-containing protein [Durotheca rogersii]KAI5863686.1 TAP-like protein-domain-containing protein [Durotheca rogersii]